MSQLNSQLEQVSKENAALSERLGELRRDLSLHRTGLLYFLDRHNVDIVPLDGGRVIKRTHVTSSKTIQPDMILTIIESAVNAWNCRDQSVPVCFVQLEEYCRQRLLSAVDVTQEKGEVLHKESMAARRISRDQSELVWGSGQLINKETQEMIDSFVTLKEEMEKLNSTRKQLKDIHQNLRSQQDTRGDNQMGFANTTGESSKQCTSQKSNVPGSSNVTRTKQTNISKKQAYSLFNNLLNHLFLTQDTMQLKDSWEDIKAEVEEMIYAFFTNTKNV